jgi:succinate dehydrogenase/fumarate reductase flavoprotein subunit
MESAIEPRERGAALRARRRFAPPDATSGCVVDGVPPGCTVDEVDVVVVGGGGAGLAAASAAAELGRTVVVLEKNRELGGSTACSVGSVAATNTPHQRRAGILDNPHDHWEDFGLFCGSDVGRDNRELARVLTENAPQTFEWLLAIGLRFVGPMPEPPHRRPRMHNVLPNAKAFSYHLGRHCRSLGVRIELGASAESLIVRDGRVAGVVARSGGARQARLAKSVVLAAGDFSASPTLKAHFASPSLSSVAPVNPASTGDGILLGLAAGGVVVNGDHLRGPFLRFVPPPSGHWLQKLPAHRLATTLMAWGYRKLPAALLRPLLMRFVTTTLAPDVGMFRAGAALIDRDGRRIDATQGTPHEAVAAAPGGIAYIIFDTNVAQRFSRWPNYVSTAPGVAYAYLDDYRRSRPDLFHRAASIRELAARLRVDATTLESSLSSAALGGVPLGTGPLYALGPAQAYVVFTNGGLAVSERLEVLREDGAPIPGLYAAGSNGQGGLLLEGHGHHLMWAFASGRLAGRNAAYEATSPCVGDAAAG